MTQSDFTYADFDPDAAPSFVEPDDIITELTADGERPEALDIARLRRLKQLRQRYALLEMQKKAIGKEIEALNGTVVEHVVEVTDADLREGWQMTVDDSTAWADVKDWPKYRQAEGAEKPYEMADLIPALAAAPLSTGLPDLIRSTVNGNSWNGAVRGLVKAWREKIDETGPPLDADGQPLDHFGNTLTAEEAEDPTADALALPPSVRAFVDITTTIELRFRQK